MGDSAEPEAPDARRGRRRRGEAEHEQQRPGQHPAAASPSARSAPDSRWRRRGSPAAAGSRGEKNDTRPASSATGTARAGEPEAADSTERPVTHPRHDLLDEVDERGGAGQRAEDARRDPALAVEHHRARDRVRGQRPVEAQQRLALGVVDRRDGCRRSARSRGVLLRRVAGVDAEERRRPVPSPLRGRDQVGRLLAAVGPTRRPRR